MYAINVLATLVIAVRSVRYPAYALVWVLVSTLLPVIGIFAWVIISRRVYTVRPPLFRRAVPDSVSPPLAETGQQIGHVVERLVGAPPRKGRIHILHSGDEKYDLLFAAIQAASTYIDLEYYIFRDDVIGNHVTQLLLSKAAEGVRVRLLVDGLGSRPFVKRLPELVGSGLECRVFAPLRFPWLSSTLNHRDHCKIVVVDDEIALCGGINIGMEYTGRKPQVGPWRDSHFGVTGGAVHDLKSLFELNWDISMPIAGRLQTTRSVQRSNGLRSAVDRSADKSLGADWFQAEVQTVEGGPDHRVQSIRSLFFLCITQAQRTLEITTPYFAPDTDLMTALKMAVVRGVRVRLLLPKFVDHKLIRLASHTYYRELLDAGVEVYLYERGLLHAKVLIADGAVAVVGAANFDLRSFRLNYEVGLVVHGIRPAMELLEQFELDLREASLLTFAQVNEVNRSRRVLEYAARLTVPLL